MYKMLIADDEQIVLDSIKFIIKKNFSNAVVVETAKSGREAIEKAEILKPDIIIMDIMMPGISGIDVIREIRSKLNGALIIILTAYESFDFAREAVKLGVMEYLLKPVSRETIMQAVEKSIDIINYNREKRKKELILKEKLESVLPILENGFFISLQFFDEYSRGVDSYKDILELNEEGGYIITIKLSESINEASTGSKTDLSTKWQTLYPYFRNVLKEKCKCLIGALVLNRILVFIPTSVKKDIFPTRHEAVNIAEYAYNLLTEKVGVDILIGIGRVYPLEDIRKSYEESLKAVNFMTESGLMHIMDVPVEAGCQSEYPHAKEKLLLDKAASGNTEVCIQTFNQIYDWLFKEYSSSLCVIKKKLLELMILVHRLGCNYKIEEEEYFKIGDYVKDFLKTEDPIELKVCCRKRIEYVSHSIRDIREKKVNNSLIIKAINYIKENYKNEITLENIAREVNISSHYLSKLFKDEMGENYIDYITSLRIQKSKDLLAENKLSSKEICFEIGYGDPNYFSRKFKDIVGITPSEYKTLTQENNKDEDVNLMHAHMQEWA